MKTRLLLLILALFFPSILPAQNTPTVNDIMEKYRATQAAQSRIWFQYRVESKGFNILSGQWTAQSGHKTIYVAGTFARDGERCAYRQDYWGHIESPREFTPENQAKHRSRLWDGKQHYQYATAKKGDTAHVGLLYINKSSDARSQAGEITSSFTGGSLMGYMHGPNAKPERIEDIMRAARTVSLRVKPEMVGGSMCHVADFKIAPHRMASTRVTSHEGYTVWFDPEHGWLPAKLESTISAIENGKLIMKVTEIVSDVRFTRIGSVWIPTEATRTARSERPKGEYSDGVDKIKITNAVINPDFEKIRAFYPDDVRDGSTVMFVGNDAEYKWQGGKLTPVVRAKPSSGGHVNWTEWKPVEQLVGY
ncbi:hypothetical protein LLG95_18900 [bacterium]|nr:hypothetical protein [bacterium]